MQLAIELMFMGMGTVFAFLVLLMFCIKLMSKVLEIFNAQVTETEIAPAQIADNTLIAIISAAIHQYRNRD